MEGIRAGICNISRVLCRQGLVYWILCRSGTVAVAGYFWLACCQIKSRDAMLSVT
jgi:hypothetical protein